MQFRSKSQITQSHTIAYVAATSITFQECYVAKILRHPIAPAQKQLNCLKLSRIGKRRLKVFKEKRARMHARWCNEVTDGDGVSKTHTQRKRECDAGATTSEIHRQFNMKQLWYIK